MSPLNNNMMMSRVPAPAAASYTIEKSYNGRSTQGYGNDGEQSASTLLGSVPSHETFVLESRNTGNGSQKFTCSFWIKGTFQGTTVLNDPSAYDSIYFSAGKLYVSADPFSSRGEYFNCNTYSVFNDTTNWHHFVIVVDTTLSTGTDRVKVYCNGQLLSLADMVFSPPAQNQTFSFYQGNIQIINETGGATYFLADFKYIDNQTLSISDLGESDTTTGEWKPKSYTFSNSANDNSYELLFADTDSSAATDFGKDTSGNSLNFTTYNIDVGNETDDSYSVFVDSNSSVPDSYMSLGATTGAELDFAYNTSWTVEFWVNFTGHQDTSGHALFGNDDRFVNFTETHSAYFKSGYSFSYGFYIELLTPGGSSITTAGNYTLSPRRWYHVAATVDGTTGRFFIDGNQVATWTSGSIFNGTSAIYEDERYEFNSDDYTKIGGDSSYPFQGYISNLRVVRGNAIYTSAFTPPTTELTAIANTEFLAFRSSSIADISTNGLTITSTGNVRVSTYSPFESDPTYEVSYDSPTQAGTNTGVGAEQSGAYCAIDHVFRSLSTHTQRVDGTYAAFPGSLGSFSLNSGKWYWEVTLIEGIVFASSDNLCFGVVANAKSLDMDPYGSHTSLLTSSTPYSHLISSNSVFYNNGSTTSNSTALRQQDVIGVALDITNLTITFYRNGTQIGSAQTLESGQEWTPVILDITPANTAYPVSVHINYGQSKYFHAAPSGFLPVNTNNLSTPAIPNPRNYVDVVSWKGNGTSQSFSTLNFDPGLVIITQYSDLNGYSSTDNRHVYDKNTGSQSALYLNANSTTQSHTTGLTAFQSGGFTLGSDNAVNESNDFYTAVCFATPASSSSNTNGSITSTTRASTTSGVSVVDYAGSGSNATVGHGLSQAPALVLVKDTSTANSWAVWHKEIANTTYLGLDSAYDFPASDSTVWNSTSPTSTVFSVGTSSLTNTGSDNYKAYCFSEIEGFSKAGQYTIGASETYKQINLGFKPAVLWVKAISGTASDATNGNGTYWYQITGGRNKQMSYLNNEDQGTFPRCQAIEELGTDYPQSYGPNIDFCSNGFYLTTSGYQYNYSANGYTYVYFAWAAAPQKYALSGF